MKKLFILFSMLIAGLSFKGVNNIDKNVVADAADVVTEDKPAEGSYAYFNRGWQTKITSVEGVTHKLIKNFLITNIPSEVKSGYLSGCPVEVGLTDTNHAPTNYTNGCAVAAYVYPNETDTTMFDCILYAHVETIYTDWADWLFAEMDAVEKITFHCDISMAKSDGSMSGMFYHNDKLEQIEGLNRLDTSNTTDMSMVFYWCKSLKEVDVSGFDTSKVTTMSEMFNNCPALTAIHGMDKWKTPELTDMKSMFYHNTSLTTLDFSNWDTSKVTTMRYLFNSCTNLTSITGLGSSNCLTNMDSIFGHCSSLTEIDVSHFDTSNVTTMIYSFNGCSKLTTIKGLEQFDTSNVTNMMEMFYYCTNLTSLDLSSFDLSSITADSNLSLMLGVDNKIREIKVPKNLNGYKIKLPYYFGMSEIDPSMAGWTLLQGSKEFNILYNNLMNLKTCDDYMQSSELQAMYDGLSNEEKEKLAILTDNDGVILANKLAYMVYLADYHSNTDTAATHMAISPRTGQYLVIVIACLSLALIGGYYFIQKKKYAK